jgi:hypothetical protein
MKAALLLLTLAISLIVVTSSFAQSASTYSLSFGYPSYAGAPYQAPRRCPRRVCLWLVMLPL